MRTHKMKTIILVRQRSSFFSVRNISFLYRNMVVAIFLIVVILTLMIIEIVKITIFQSSQ